MPRASLGCTELAQRLGCTATRRTKLAQTYLTPKSTYAQARHTHDMNFHAQVRDILSNSSPTELAQLPFMLFKIPASLHPLHGLPELRIPVWTWQDGLRSEDVFSHPNDRLLVCTNWNSFDRLALPPRPTISLLEDDPAGILPRLVNWSASVQVSTTLNNHVPAFFSCIFGYILILMQPFWEVPSSLLPCSNL
jgi:hypothetical protein